MFRFIKHPSKTLYYSLKRGLNKSVPNATFNTQQNRSSSSSSSSSSSTSNSKTNTNPPSQLLTIISGCVLVGGGYLYFASSFMNTVDEKVQRAKVVSDKNLQHDLEIIKLSKSEDGVDQILKQMAEQRESQKSVGKVKAAMAFDKDKSEPRSSSEPSSVEEKKVEETLPQEEIKKEERKEEKGQSEVIKEVIPIETPNSQEKVEITTKIVEEEPTNTDPLEISETNEPANPFKDAEILPSEELAKELDQRIENELKSEAEFKEKLDSLILSTASSVKTAISLQELAASSISDHTKLVRVAMDDINFSHQQKAENWALAAQGLEKRESARRAAADPTLEARQNLLAFKEFVNLMVEQFPGLKDDILRAEDWYSEMKKELDTSVIITASRLTEAEIMSNYSKMVQDARDDFQKELFAEETLPDDIVKIKEGWLAQAEKPSLDRDELNSLLAHAYHQINALKQELSSEREKITQKMSDAVSDNRFALLQEAEDKIKSETQAEFDRLQSLHNEKLFEIRNKYEAEVVIQLKRQAAAHIDHMTEVTAKTEANTSESVTSDYLQKIDEIKAGHDQDVTELLETHVDAVKNLIFNHESQLEKSNAVMDGINSSLSDRTTLEGKIENSRMLGLAVKSLNEAVIKGNASLKSQLDVVLKFGDDTTKAIVNSLLSSRNNSEILTSGVKTRDDLKLQFLDLIESCRSLQSLPNSESGLAARLFETVKSKFQYNFALLPTSLEPPSVSCSTDLNTSDYLAFATFCVEKGDLEQAARFLAQVENVQICELTDGWIVDVCRLSEFQRAVTAIGSVSEAISLSLC